VGCVEQKPVIDSSGKAQMQPLLQGLFAPQLPPQANPLALLRNCRAESAPALRTAVIIAASNVFLITFLLMIFIPLIPVAGQFDADPPPWISNQAVAPICYFSAGAAPASFEVQNAVNGVVKEQTQFAAQGWFTPQLPPQAKPFGSLRNWRAETVPAHRTDVTMVANSIALAILLDIVRAPFI
jgi:hypothetical protein